MDNTQGGDPAARVDDWRSQLQPEARNRIVNKIMETLKKHQPVSVPEELRQIAVRFEEKIYAAATSQSDYLRKISLKMLSTAGLNEICTQENPQHGQVVQNQSPSYLGETEDGEANHETNHDT